MTDGLKDAHREAIIAVVAANDRVERAVLFGSRATGTNTVSSDVDIALFGDRLTLTDQARLAAVLDEIPMAQSVDLVLHDSIQGRTLREHVRCEGVEWYARPNHEGTGGITSGAANTWPIMSLREAGVSLIDCEHRTPPASEDGYPYVGIPQIKDGRVDLDGARYIAQEHFREWTRRAKPQPFDIVLSRRCNPGNAGFVAPGLVEFALGQNLVLLRSDGEKILKPFLRWLVRSPRWWAQVGKYINVGAVFDSLKCADIPGFRLPIPPRSEQRAIAHILGTLDDKIELNRRMNETLEATARALFKSWFVDFDPVRAKMEGRDTGLPDQLADLFPDRLVDSELEEIPEGWTVFRLDHLARQHTKSTSPYRFPELEYEHFSIPAYDAAQRPAIEPGGAIRSNKTGVQENAVLLSKLNPRIARVWVPDDATERPQICSTEFLVFTPRSPANRSLLFALFADQRFRLLLKSLVTGTSTSHQRVPPKALKAQEVLAGSPKAFAVFGEAIGDMLSRILKNRSEVATLTALRDAILPQLISGELRAQPAEKFIGVSGEPDRSHIAST